MKPLAQLIAQELAEPAAADLQERLLQAMLLMERYRGLNAGSSSLAPDVEDADVSTPAITVLAEALRRFIRTFPQHSDVSSAIWALGKLRAAVDAPLFELIYSSKSGYTDKAREQAICALEDLTG